MPPKLLGLMHLQHCHIWRRGAASDEVVALLMEGEVVLAIWLCEVVVSGSFE